MSVPSNRSRSAKSESESEYAENLVVIYC